MSLKRNTIANYLGQGWTAVMGLAFVPAYIHYLGVEAWGLVGFMAMLQAWLTLLDMGFTPTLSREMARFLAGAHEAQSIRDLLRSLEVVYGGVAVAVVAVVWFSAPWLAVHWLNAATLSAETLGQVIGMIGFVLASRMTEQVYRGAIQGLQQQVWLNLAQSVLATLRWGGVVGVLAWVDASIEAFFLWQGLISLITVIVFASYTYQLLPRASRPGRFRLSAIVEVRRFAAGMALTSFLAVLLTQVDKLLLTKLVSLEDFGYYTLAATTSSALVFLISPIASAIFPHLTDLFAKSEQQALVESYHRGAQWLSATLTPAALMMAGFSEPLLMVWTGDARLASQTAPILTLLALGTYCNGLMHVPYMTQLAHGWTGFGVRVNIVAVAVIVPAILWAVPRYGAIGAAWAWFALNAGYVIIGMHFMHKKILTGEKWRWYRDAVLVPLGCGLLLLLLLRQWVTLPQSRLAEAAVLMGLGLLVLSAVLVATPGPRTYLQHKLASYRKHSPHG